MRLHAIPVSAEQLNLSHLNNQLPVGGIYFIGFLDILVDIHEFFATKYGHNASFIQVHS